MASQDISAYINSLLLSHPLREPIMKKVIQLMKLPLSSYGLDVGCGIGLNTLLLAEELGADGRVIGIDSEEDMISKARFLLNESGLKDRIRLEKGDARTIAFPDQCFDWACSNDCVGAVDIDPVILLKELRRVVKPGGKIFITIWSSQMLLSGFPQVETQLNATSGGIAPFAVGMPPGRHIMRAPDWFRQAGFKDIQAQTLVRDIGSPLSVEVIAALTDLFKMRWGSIEREVNPELWRDYQRLCNPDSPEFILNVTDYYAFFTFSVFSGLV